MARRRWSQGAWVYAFWVIVLFFVLLLPDTARLWRSWQAHGAVLTGPFWAAASLAMVTAVALWWLGRGVLAARSSPAGNRLRLGAVGLWSLGMLGLLVATHPTRRMRLFSNAFGGPDSTAQFALVAYQVLIWVVMLVALAVFARRWRSAGGFGAEARAHDPSPRGPGRPDHEG